MEINSFECLLTGKKALPNSPNPSNVNNLANSNKLLKIHLVLPKTIIQKLQKKSLNKIKQNLKRINNNNKK